MTTITTQYQGHTLTITDEHSASSYGQPVMLVDDDLTPYGPSDGVPCIAGGIMSALGFGDPQPIEANQIARDAWIGNHDRDTIQGRFVAAGDAAYLRRRG